MKYFLIILLLISGINSIGNCGSRRLGDTTIRR